MFLNRDNIRTALPIKEIELPNRLTVRVKAFSAKMIADNQENESFFKNSQMIVSSLVDEHGEQLFKNDEADELLQFLDLNSFNVLLNAIMEINGFGEEAEKN